MDGDVLQQPGPHVIHHALGDDGPVDADGRVQLRRLISQHLGHGDLVEAVQDLPRHRFRQLLPPDQLVQRVQQRRAQNRVPVQRAGARRRRLLPDRVVLKGRLLHLGGLGSASLPTLASRR